VGTSEFDLGDPTVPGTVFAVRVAVLVFERALLFEKHGALALDPNGEQIAIADVTLDDPEFQDVAVTQARAEIG